MLKRPRYERIAQSFIPQKSGSSYLISANISTFPGCGSVVSNSLKSPGYPSSYPNNMYCVYRVYIPYGMAMNIYFSYFYLEGGSCRLVIKHNDSQLTLFRPG